MMSSNPTDALQIIAMTAFEGIKQQATQLAASAGDELATALKDAGRSGLALIEAAVNGQINSDELKTALREIEETIAGAIAGEVFDGQRDVLALLKSTALEYLPKLLAAV